MEASMTDICEDTNFDEVDYFGRDLLKTTRDEGEFVSKSDYEDLIKSYIHMKKEYNEIVYNMKEISIELEKLEKQYKRTYLS
jgi:DNA-binding transcriptional regulator YhcF (GntR family)